MPQAHDTATLRHQLTTAFDDVALDAFCLDHFCQLPAVYEKLARGLRPNEKITLLLDHCRRQPGELERLADLLSQYPPSTFRRALAVSALLG
ncbi:MAG: hypothetical protein ACFFA6_15540 [Promethearchaeota archaeon]